MSASYDILIRNCAVYDGSGSEAYRADIGVTKDRISMISAKSSAGLGQQQFEGMKVIDADGLSVAPGFIDTHSHSEFTLLADPRADGKIRQGITTEINGNCGISAAPLFGDALEQRESDLAEYHIRERWRTFREYFQLLEQRGLAVNFVTLTGHGNLRACAAGYRDRKLSVQEHEKMRTMLRESICDGSAGISTGLIYPPGIYADTEELIHLCTELMNSESYGAPVYATHMRSEGDHLIESIDETITIAKESGIRVHISHLKTSGERNWDKMDAALSGIVRARERGISITFDRYPYSAASTDLDTVLPSWTYEGGAEQELKRLLISETHSRIREEVLASHPEEEYWGKILITSVANEHNRWMEGKNLRDIAQREKCEPVDMLLKVLVEERLRVGAIFSSMSEANLIKILSDPYGMIGTDSAARSFDGPTCKGKPHPRGFGSFPRYLGRYVRDILRIDLGEAIRRVTRLPALTFGISARGIIEVGAYADMVIFDSRKILDKSTYEEPYMPPEGICYVLVNGIPAIWEGQSTGLGSGRILRNGK